MGEIESLQNVMRPQVSASLGRARTAYPFDVGSLGILQVDAGEPQLDGDASFRNAAARGAAIEIDKTVQVLGGASKATADGKGSLISVGEGTSLRDCTLQINGPDCHIIIGPRCRLKGLKVIVRRPNSTVIIGAGTSWESGAILSESGNMVVLGNDCMVSNGVVLRTSDGHGIFDAGTGRRLNAPADVFVGHHVWLGNSSRVNKGAIIGSGSVIGQAAVVSGRLEGGCIYAGMPARKLRENIAWSRTEAFEDIPAEYLA